MEAASSSAAHSAAFGSTPVSTNASELKTLDAYLHDVLVFTVTVTLINVSQVHF